MYFIVVFVSVFLLREGRLEVRQATSDGGSVVLAELDQGTYVGG